MSTSKKKAKGPPVRTAPQIASDFVRNLAARYTKHTDHLKVDGGETGDIVVVAMRAHRDDHPRLVGSGGKNISALQWLCARLGDAMGKRVRLTLLDPIHGEKGPLHEFQEDPQWRPESTTELLREVVGAIVRGPFLVECMRMEGLATFSVGIEDPSTAPPASEMQTALHTLFHAIGKTEGQQIHVEVVPTTQAEPAANGTARA